MSCSNTLQTQRFTDSVPRARHSLSALCMIKDCRNNFPSMSVHSTTSTPQKSTHNPVTDMYQTPIIDSTQGPSSAPSSSPSLTSPFQPNTAASLLISSPLHLRVPSDDDAPSTDEVTDNDQLRQHYEAQYTLLSIRRLREMCKLRGLRVRGSKVEVVDRLAQDEMRTLEEAWV